MHDNAAPNSVEHLELGFEGAPEGEVKDKCAVVAVYDPEGDAAHIAHLALKALQHRGQDGAGISYIEQEAREDNGSRIGLKKAFGRVATGFQGGKLLQGIGPTEGAAGQVSYGITETDNAFDALQPIFITALGKTYSLQHNGQFDMDNLDELAVEHGTGYYGTDSERVADLLKQHIEEQGHIEPAMQNLLPQLEGAFSMTILSEDASYGIRDRHGVRPLVLGTVEDKRMISSEVCGLKAADEDGNPQLDFKLKRVVPPGTYVVMNEDGFREERWAEKDSKFCIFEDVYLSKPDNVMTEDGITAGEYRVNAGAILAHRDKASSSMIIPVLGSAKSYAKGYEAASDITYVEALKKNPDRKNPESDRTFIEKTQEAREAAVRDKFIVEKELVNGQDVTLIDDSLVRGTTTKIIIKMLKEAGAQKVHVRIGSPRYTKKCTFGVNVQSEEELLSYNRTIEEMAEVIGADSLEFLTTEEMYDARGVKKEEVCDGCMGGSYPQPRKEVEGIPLPMAA